MIIALVAHVALAAGVSTAEIDKALEPKLASLLATYKDLHASPELSEQEEKTSQKLAAKLKSMGYTVTTNFGRYDDQKKPAYGVVAVLKNGEGPTLLMRADMDALPITEETGLPFASKVRTKTATGLETGVMHACGHDVHMTSLLGTAEVMAQMKDRWRGTLMLIAQPAEEVGSGAKSMLTAGLYEKFGKPTFALGMHVDSETPAGLVTTRPGFVLANVNTVFITMRGIGGHGAYPNLVKDPVVMSGELIVALQTLVSRELPPGEAGVVTVGSIHGGTKSNIIPDEVKLSLTVRSYKEEVRKTLLDGITRIANGIAETNGVPKDRMPIIDVSAVDQTPATYNNPELSERLLTLWKSELGADNARLREARMGGEDFSRYTLTDRSVPSVFFFVGASDPKAVEAHDKEGKPLAQGHTARYAPVAEVAIKRGVEATVTAATTLLAK
jgi:amidohydrolase